MSRESDQQRQWVEAWRSAGPALDTLRREKLRNYKYEEHREEIFGLLELAHRHRKPRLTSGLVELQRLLQKLRK